MVAENLASIIRAPGRIVVDPTDLANPYPYGGVEVGLTSEILLKPLGTRTRVWSEGLGEATDILEADNRWQVEFFCRGYDDDAVEQFFPGGYSQGAVSRHAVWTAPSADIPGESVLANALIVLFVPDDLIRVPAMLAYAAVPDFQEAAEMAFQRPRELGLPVSLECFRDLNGVILRVGLIADLLLS